MRPFLVVVTASLLDDDPCLLQALKDLTVVQLVAKLADEAFAVSVLPGAARFDEQSLRAYLRELSVVRTVGTV